jgi:hypothetical protein
MTVPVGGRRFLFLKECLLVSHRALIPGIIVTLLLLAVIPGISAQIAPTTPPALSVYWYPKGYPVTPYDTVNIQANVTSSSAIRNVTIYYRIGPFGLELNSVSDYNRSSMQGPAVANHGIWSYHFEPQKNGTAIYFVLSAFDNSGLQTLYPGNQPFSNPQIIRIEFPSKPSVSVVNVNLNTVTITDTSALANVSISMAAYLPSPHEAGWFEVTVSTVGSYPVGYLSLYESPNSRFFYIGQGSWLVYLNPINPTNELPYDTYSLDLNLTLLYYHFDNLSDAVKNVWVQVGGAAEVWNSWNIVTSVPEWNTYHNSTVEITYTSLSRRIPNFYPPLVLMLVAIGVLGLVPLVSTYDPTKRFDIFLSVIILGSSAELSQTIYPATGYHGDNIFLESFALVLGATIFMMAVSSLPEEVRTKTFRGFQRDWYADTIIIALMSVFIFRFTNFPGTAKVLTPILGLSGLAFVLLYRCSPKVVIVLRLGLKRKMKEWKTLRRRILKRI